MECNQKCCEECVKSMKRTGKLCEEHERMRKERDGERAERAKKGESMIPDGTVYSVMVPWVEVWVMEDMMRGVMSELGWGEIVGVDFVHRKGEGGKRDHYKVFVHYGSVSGMEESGAKAMLEKGNDAKVWYSERYFWKVRKSRYVHQEREEKKKFAVKCEF